MNLVIKRSSFEDTEMESYIVRIYRRDDEQNIIAGIVEVADMQEQKPFKNYDELLTILNMIERPDAKILWETK